MPKLLGVAHQISVSYTHLRAHETVLDLVCRLLLEKKTTYKHMIIYYGDQSPERRYHKCSKV